MTNTLTSPTSTDGRVRTLADVAVICAEAGLDPVRSNPHRWAGTRIVVHCWPTRAFQVVVYSLDAAGDPKWSGIFDYETPATVIAHVIDDAR